MNYLKDFFTEEQFNRLLSYCNDEDGDSEDEKLEWGEEDFGLRGREPHSGY